MNVLELADKWDAQGFSEYELERECGNQMANMLRQKQAEIEALKKHNEELQKACVDSLVWVMGNGVYCSLDIEVILKNVLGSEWEDYK